MTSVYIIVLPLATIPKSYGLGKEGSKTLTSSFFSLHSYKRLRVNYVSLKGDRLTRVTYLEVEGYKGGY